MSFYLLGIEESEKEEYACGIEIHDLIYQQYNCSQCGRTWNKDFFYDHTISFEIAMSTENYPDFSVVEHHLIVLEKNKDLLSQKITGINFGDLKMISNDSISQENVKKLKAYGFQVDEFSKKPPNYLKMFVTGKVKLHEKTRMELIEKCNYCGYEKFRNKDGVFLPVFYLLEESWDKSDLFNASEFPLVIFCSQNFFEIYHNNKMTGLTFEEVKMI